MSGVGRVCRQQVAAEDDGALGGCEAAAQGGRAAGGWTAVPALLLRPAGPGVGDGAAQQVTDRPTCACVRACARV